jgi:hypothetical protein
MIHKFDIDRIVYINPAELCCNYTVLITVVAVVGWLLYAIYALGCSFVSNHIAS